jgi:hypothetical protein
MWIRSSHDPCKSKPFPTLRASLRLGMMLRGREGLNDVSYSSPGITTNWQLVPKLTVTA